ncbi:hypothetical protein SCG7109_AR_00140 [Chlamydiales bacterium SCGC AG-110-M15]|nr:hypothetical protein SCG7109_AR_00140 [Chlamydiales bacterium SCGC AG-110-M15]
MRTYDICYSDRESRNQFIADELHAYLGHSILNVGGGGENFLKSFLPKETQYVEIDIAGSPDYLINLETDLPLPFKDNSFETTIATDVLEHIETFHEVFEELIRITNRYVIISLPNSFVDTFAILKNRPYKNDNSELRRQSYGKYMKYYGLPYSRPPDRHKHFLTYTDIVEFIQYHEKQGLYKIKEIFPIGYKRKNPLKNFALSFLGLTLGKEARMNLSCPTCWAILEKKQEPAMKE